MNRRQLRAYRLRPRRFLATASCALALVAQGVHAQALRSELLDPRVTQSTIVDTICRPGYADEVLPPFEALMRQKDDLIRQYRIDPANASQYALDHRMPVLLGGSPTAEANVDLRRWDGHAGQRRKERVVVFLKRCVCTGDMPLAQAQTAIWGDWSSRYPNLSSMTCSAS